MLNFIREAYSRTGSLILTFRAYRAYRGVNYW